MLVSTGTDISYDTDDMTNRQHYYWNKLGRPNEFLVHCVQKNYEIGSCENYPGDCDIVFQYSDDILSRCGINPDEVYLAY